MANHRNCSSQFGAYSALDRNYRPFLACPYVSSDCGVNPSPQSRTDPEYDARFGENYYIARSGGASISLATTIKADKTCVYVVVKDRTKQALMVNVTFLAGADVAIHRSTRLFTTAPTISYRPIVKTDYDFEAFGDTEYLYIIVKSKINGGSAQISFKSYKDKLIPIEEPDEVSSEETNWPLIVGLVVGIIGFIALSAFMGYYLVKLYKKRQAQKAIEDTNGVRRIQQKNAAEKKLINPNEEEDEDEYDDEEEKAPPPVKGKKNYDMPVHPEGKPVAQKYNVQN